jgi:glutamate/tyrosine decarboxylase-like PLP-dependent enzyme
MMVELELLESADRLGREYVAANAERRAFPDNAAIANLAELDEALPEVGYAQSDTIALLDRIGSPATVASNGPNYFGYVVGATLPVAAAADRLVLAWDQCASSFDNSPACATIERIAGRWILEILDLPRESAVGFSTSATASTISCISAARRRLLANLGWDFDRDGLVGAPEIKVVVSANVHVTVKKALKILGFGMNRLQIAATDAQGRVDPDHIPTLDGSTILCLQAGEVNTGNFDPFEKILPEAKRSGAWVHVDGAFGLWARASASAKSLTTGVDQADSWTTDGHKWLNTPYDGAMAICRDAAALAEAANSDAAYAVAAATDQKNLTLEFSRRARGVPIWAVLRSLGKQGVADLVDRHRAQAQSLANALRQTGFHVLNEVSLNQVLVQCDDAQATLAMRAAINASGQAWVGGTSWQGEPAIRISLSSWRIGDENIEALVAKMFEIRQAISKTG